MASQYLAKGLKRSALTIALGLCFAGGVQAQSTTGGITGTVPAGATVTISNNSGLTRTITADANGRYVATNLPVGTYTVVAGGERRDVVVTVGSNANVSFGGGTTTLGTVTVTGNVVNPIDTTTTDTRSVLTAEQLERLPLARSAESVALLAPGVISGAAGYFGGLVSFGGSGVSENAYYINGFFSGEPLSNLGGFSLPYGSIEQQETFLGGYSAKYGRSAGGVINQIGKRGNNDFKFGGQVVYTPRDLRGKADDLYLPDIDFSAYNQNPNLPSTCGDGNDKCGWGYEDPTKAGTLYSRGDASESWNHSYSLYAGGPIIRDRLFFFASGEMYKSNSIAAPSALGTPRVTDTEVEDPKVYAKIDWNITDNHFLELSYMGEKYTSAGEYYAYDFANGTRGALLTSIVPTPVSQNTEYSIAKYTGYLTDTLTFSALYGHGRFTNRQINPSIVPGVPFISSATNQNPALNGGTAIPNKQGGYQATDARNYTDGIRADLEWIVGDHTLTFGVDNIKFEAENAGVDQVADVWIYSRTNSPSSNISSALGVGAPGSNYYVQKYIYETATSMSLEQKAWYVEDRWLVTPNLMLSLGLRNDQFTNKNNLGESYMDAKDQWAPRLGFAWDAFGDSSLKVFGNAGRYFLAMPNNVAIRGASASTFTREYFTYTGIDANGAPTGLVAIGGTNGRPPPGPVSSNGEYGTPVDVLSFAPKDLKNMYQDEYILGMEKSLGDRWMMGFKLTGRDLKSSIDDICDPYTFMDHNGLTAVRGAGNGYLARDAAGQHYQVSYCYMFNPGGTNTFSIAETDANANPTGGRRDFVMSYEDWRFDQGLRRKYSGLDIYLERVFDGVWEARLDYTYSKSQGNNEGQVKSEFGQTNISKTQDWDVAEMMRFAHGYLANDRRHQLKMRGSYQITPELLLGANLRVTSGAPISCLGLFNPDGSIDEGTTAADPVGYGSSYHTCFGQVATPGSERTPWTKTLDLGLTYRPAMFADRLALGLQVRNVTNENEALQVDVTSGTDDPYTISNTYLLPIGRQTPRTVVLTASYDW